MERRPSDKGVGRRARGGEERRGGAPRHPHRPRKQQKRRRQEAGRGAWGAGRGWRRESRSPERSAAPAPPARTHHPQPQSPESCAPGAGTFARFPPPRAAGAVGRPGLAGRRRGEARRRGAGRRSSAAAQASPGLPRPRPLFPTGGEGAPGRRGVPGGVSSDSIPRDSPGGRQEGSASGSSRHLSM